MTLHGACRTQQACMRLSVQTLSAVTSECGSARQSMHKACINSDHVPDLHDHLQHQAGKQPHAWQRERPRPA